MQRNAFMVIIRSKSLQVEGGGGLQQKSRHLVNAKLLATSFSITAFRRRISVHRWFPHVQTVLNKLINLN